MNFSFLLYVVILFLLLRYFYLLVKHMKLKEYFWNIMSDENKKFINYIGYKKVLFVNDIPWANKLRDFLQKRNSLLKKSDSLNAENLIILERKLCIMERLIMISIFICIIIEFN